MFDQNSGMNLDRNTGIHPSIFCHRCTCTQASVHFPFCCTAGPLTLNLTSLHTSPLSFTLKFNDQVVKKSEQRPKYPHFPKPCTEFSLQNVETRPWSLFSFIILYHYEIAQQLSHNHWDNGL